MPRLCKRVKVTKAWMFGYRVLAEIWQWGFLLTPFVWVVWVGAGTFHLQKAADATLEYQVEKDLLNKIWEEKYLSAHPDARPDLIEAIKKENEVMRTVNDTVRTQNDAMRAEIESLKARIESNAKEYQLNQEIGQLSNQVEKLEDNEAARRKYAAGMWTGVGLGSVGIA